MVYSRFETTKVSLIEEMKNTSSMWAETLENAFKAERQKILKPLSMEYYRIIANGDYIAHPCCIGRLPDGLVLKESNQ